MRTGEINLYLFWRLDAASAKLIVTLNTDNDVHFKFPTQVISYNCHMSLNINRPIKYHVCESACLGLSIHKIRELQPTIQHSRISQQNQSELSQTFQMFRQRTWQLKSWSQYHRIPVYEEQCVGERKVWPRLFTIEIFHNIIIHHWIIFLIFQKKTIKLWRQQHELVEMYEIWTSFSGWETCNGCGRMCCCWSYLKDFSTRFVHKR